MSEDLRDVPSRGDQAVDRAEYERLLLEMIDKLREGSAALRQRVEEEHARAERMTAHAHDSDCEAQKLAERVEELERNRNVKIEIIHPPKDERITALTEQIVNHYAEAVEWRDTAEREKRNRKAAEAEVKRLERQLNASLLGLNEARSRVLQAEAEVERLREAAEEAVEWWAGNENPWPWLIKLRAALAPEVKP